MFVPLLGRGFRRAQYLAFDLNECQPGPAEGDEALHRFGARSERSWTEHETMLQLLFGVIEQCTHQSGAAFEGRASLPFYNEDVDVPESSIEAVVALRAAATDALLLATPEYTTARVPFPVSVSR